MTGNHLKILKKKDKLEIDVSNNLMLQKMFKFRKNKLVSLQKFNNQKSKSRLDSSINNYSSPNQD